MAEKGRNNNPGSHREPSSSSSKFLNDEERLTTLFQKLEGAKLALSDDDITDFIDQANEVVISRLENGYTTGDVSADCWAFMMYLDDNYGERNNIDRIDLWDCISEDWPDEPVYHMAAMYLSWVESKMDRVILNPRQEMNLRSLIQHIGSIHSYRTLHFPDPEMRHRTFHLYDEDTEDDVAEMLMPVLTHLLRRDGYLMLEYESDVDEESVFCCGFAFFEGEILKIPGSTMPDIWLPNGSEGEDITYHDPFITFDYGAPITDEPAPWPLPEEDRISTQFLEQEERCQQMQGAQTPQQIISFFRKASALTALRIAQGCDLSDIPLDCVQFMQDYRDLYADNQEVSSALTEVWGNDPFLFRLANHYHREWTEKTEKIPLSEEQMENVRRLSEYIINQNGERMISVFLDNGMSGYLKWTQDDIDQKPETYREGITELVLILFRTNGQMIFRYGMRLSDAVTINGFEVEEGMARVFTAEEVQSYEESQPDEILFPSDDDIFAEAAVQFL